MRTKMLGIGPMLRNINSLGEGDRAYCGPFGTVTCYRSAKNSESGERLFRVEGSFRLVNRGLWTMKTLRKAVTRRPKLSGRASK